MIPQTLSVNDTVAFSLPGLPMAVGTVTRVLPQAVEVSHKGHHRTSLKDFALLSLEDCVRV